MGCDEPVQHINAFFSIQKQKRPLAERAFEKNVGPEFEDPTRSGCRHRWQPLQASRLSTRTILLAQALVGSTLMREYASFVFYRLR